jgi:uncharacterized protein (DUF58 family)
VGLFASPRVATSTTAGVHCSLADLIALQYAARSFSLVGRQPPTSVLAGRHSTRLRGRGLSFEELRSYQPGDDVRHIDWRVTARTRTPHTRVYAEERERPVLLVVDQRLAMFYGTVAQMKSVTAAELAALVAWQVLSAGDRIGALVFSDDHFATISPKRSRQTLMQLFEAIVHYNRQLCVNAGLRNAPQQLNSILAGLSRRTTHDWLVVIISDFHGMDDATRGHIQRIARHNDVIAALVQDPSAQQLPRASRLIISDTHLQAELDLGQARIRHAIATAMQTRTSLLERIRRELGVAVLPIDTCGDVARQLASLLGTPVARAS